MLKVFRGGLNLISLQSKILILLIFISFISILVVSLVSYNSGQAALKEAILSNLISIRKQTAREIETYFQFTEAHVLSMGETPLVIDSTKAFKAAYQKLGTQQLTQQQQQILTTFYQKEYLPRLAQNTGTQPVLQGYVPFSPAAKYLQYYYIAANPRPLAAKENLNKAADESD